jgi:superfamily II DNA/RNA helicase
MTSFSDLGLSPEVLQAVADAGYTEPTPIQEQAIPIALQGRDVLGIAQTGTGKTAGFTLPMIDRLAAGRSKARMPRSLVIEPTRELADQVAASFEKYASQHKLSWALLIGGVSFDDQLKKLDRGVDVLIATPGRLLDHFERGKLLLTGVQILVVDEADRMLDMGFIPDIERIFKLTPAKKQTLFFSATMPPEITRLTKQFLHDPVRIEASAPATTAETITQHIARIPSSDPKAKRLALRALVEQGEVKNGIVFCNRKSEVDIVAKSLKKHGFDASPIHGDLDQSQRMRTLDAFRKGELKLLVASDVAARGLDIPDVSHVFNYDVPHHADDYVHRIGRTGRAGRKGDAFMIVTPADSRSLDKVLKLIGKNPDEVKLDLDWASAKSEDRPGREPRGRSSSRERGPRRERGERHERHEAPAPEPAQAAAPEEAAPAPAEARAEQPRRDRPERRERSERPERQERHERPERHQRQERQERQGRPEREPAAGRNEEGRVVGFGNDVPAFLARPAPRVAPASAED